MTSEMRDLSNLQRQCLLAVLTACLFLSHGIDGILSITAQEIGSYFLLKTDLVDKNGNSLGKGSLVQVVDSRANEVSLKFFKQSADRWVEASCGITDPKLRFSAQAWAATDKETPTPAVKNGELYLKRADGKFYPLFRIIRGSPLQCPPASTIQTLTNQSLSIEQAAKKNKLADNLEWVRSLNLGRYFRQGLQSYRARLREIQRKKAINPRSVSRKELLYLDRLRSNASAGLGRAKRELILKLKARVDAKLMTEAEASDVIISLTLFGEFRGDRQEKFNFFPRDPAHLFWMTKVLEERPRARDKDGEPRFSRHRLSIHLPTADGRNGSPIAFLSETPAGAALAESQWSVWNANAENGTLATMLNPGPHDSSEQVAMNAISHFLGKYRAGHYEMIGDDPRIDHYDSPSAYYSLPYLSSLVRNERNRDKQRAILWNYLRRFVKFKGVSIPPIRDKTLEGKIYEVDPRAFIGGH